MPATPGLRRFVRPAPGTPAETPQPTAPQTTAPQAAAAAAPGAPAAVAAPPAPTSAQEAADVLPALMAELLQGVQAPADGGPLVGGLLSQAGPVGQLGQAGQLGQVSQLGQVGQDVEKCELCAAVIPAEHGHVADLESSTLTCACRACYLLFTQSTAARGRYRAVPDRYLHDPDRPLTPAQWDQLEIPVGLAFFLRTSAQDSVAGFYPSPAGVTECILDLTAWERLTEEYPLLGVPAVDVEAALICRTDNGVEYFVVPIDACYELAGRMRLYWRGFDGGAEAKASIADFLDKVRSQVRVFRADI